MTAFLAPSPRRPSCVDALEMLANGHEQARLLAEECRRFARHATPGRDMRQVADTLCKAIHRMASLEEELFYPAAREALGCCDLVDLAALEHATARQIIQQMRLTASCEARYEALVVALIDCVERHARREQNELFPRLRQSCLDMTALGERISARQRELEVAH